MILEVPSLFYVYKNVYKRPVSAQEEKESDLFSAGCSIFLHTWDENTSRHKVFSPFVLSVSRSLLCPLSVHTHMTHVYLPRFREAELQCWTTKPKCSCTDVASERTQKQRAGLIELGNWPLFTTEMTFPTAGSDTSVELISVRNSLKRGRKTWQAALFQLLFNCRVLSCS